jgi:hypothetical protein
LGGYLKEKPHEEDIDEIIHRKFAGTVSARMLVADGGAVGFKIADEPPSAEQLAFSKEKEVPGDALVGVSILYNWPVVGWCMGQIVERNTTMGACSRRMAVSE